MDFLLINWVQFHKMIVNLKLEILAIKLILMKNNRNLLIVIKEKVNKKKNKLIVHIHHMDNI